MFRLRMIALAAAVFVPAALALTAPTAGQQNTTIGVSLAQDDNPFYIAAFAPVPRSSAGTSRRSPPTRTNSNRSMACKTSLRGASRAS
jgi:hypothetical protein